MLVVESGIARESAKRLPRFNLVIEMLVVERGRC